MLTDLNCEKESRTIIERKGPVKIISLEESDWDGERKISLEEWLVYSVCFVLTLVCIIFLLKGKYIVISLLFASLSIGGALLYSKAKSMRADDYIPRLSFGEYRRRQIIAMKIFFVFLICSIIFTAILFRMNMIFDFLSIALAMLTVSITGLIYYRKGFVPVGLVSNPELEEIIGMEEGEHIWGNYKNFDSTISSHKQNDTIILVTDRKIFYANYSGGKWFSLMRYMNEIAEIGIAGYGSYEVYLRLRFTDNTSLELNLSLYDKRTSNAIVFVESLLTSLDISLFEKNKAQEERNGINIISQKGLFSRNEKSCSKDPAIRGLNLSQCTLSSLTTTTEYAPGSKISYSD